MLLFFTRRTRCISTSLSSSTSTSRTRRRFESDPRRRRGIATRTRITTTRTRRRRIIIPQQQQQASIVFVNLLTCNVMMMGTQNKHQYTYFSLSLSPTFFPLCLTSFFGFVFLVYYACLFVCLFRNETTECCNFLSSLFHHIFSIISRRRVIGQGNCKSRKANRAG